jgi:hypothetical protein
MVTSCSLVAYSLARVAVAGNPESNEKRGRYEGKSKGKSQKPKVKSKKSIIEAFTEEFGHAYIQGCKDLHKAADLQV